MTSLLKTPSLSINLDQAQTPLDSVKTGQSLDVPTGQAGVLISELLISPSNSLSDIALQEVSAIVYHPMTVSNCTNATKSHKSHLLQAHWQHSFSLPLFPSLPQFLAASLSSLPQQLPRRRPKLQLLYAFNDL